MPEEGRRTGVLASGGEVRTTATRELVVPRSASLRELIRAREKASKPAILPSGS